MMIKGEHRVVLLALICAVGLLLGMAGRAAFEDFQARADSMVMLFEDWCIPRLQGIANEPGPPLQPLRQKPGEILWVDPISKIALRVGQKGCRVSDALEPLGPEGASAVTQMVTDRMTTWSPTLNLYASATVEGSDAFLFWLSSEDPSDPQSWGITLTRFTATGEGSTTERILALPRTQ